ncbi:tRNA-dihydrouridine synthase family protein [Candidatus Woesearchaeota archaeon]|nr:tRNA-dihydrouridine synthase family protein [Candidatus Woesearchaeota archaeon]
MKLFLAPLEGVSDCAFRTLCYNHGADLTFTEMIRVDSLVRQNKATLALLDLKNNVPTGIQLLAIKPASAQEFVKMFPSFDFVRAPEQINLNCGCPSPDVIRQGGGAALVKRVQRLQELITIFRKLSLPVTLKIRLGLNSYEKKHNVYLNLIKNVDADAFIVHARDARQSSKEKADWSVFEECIATGKNIIPNGDISEKEHLAHFRQLGVKEVMIGRAAVRNPSVFAYLKGKERVSIANLREEYHLLCKEYPNNLKYKENVLSYLGKEEGIHSRKWLM